MRYLLLSVLVVSLVGFLIFSNGGIEAETSSQIIKSSSYTDPENKFSIRAPINWLATETIDPETGLSAVAFTPPSEDAILMIHEQTIDLCSPYCVGHFKNYLEHLTKNMMESKTGYDCNGYTVIESKILELDINRESFLVRFTCVGNIYDGEPKYPMFGLQVLIPDEDKLWFLQSKSFEHKDYSNTFLPMIKSFSLNPVSIQTPNPTTVTTPPEPDDRSGVGEALFIIIIVVVAVIVIKRRKKKIPIPVPNPMGGVMPMGKGGRGKILRRGRLPIMGKFKLPIKRTVGKQQLKQKSEMEPIHLLRCGNIACRMEKFLVTEADGQQYCTKCGWKKR